MNHDFLMTGAELQALREACGLDRDQFAMMCGIGGKPPGRTIKHWETGGSNHGVPADVATLVLELFAKVTQDARDEIARRSGCGPTVLFRGADPLKNQVASRVYQELLRLGQDVRLVAFDYRTYRAWLDDGRMTDTPANKQAWAALQVKAQSKPHRADQPA